MEFYDVVAGDSSIVCFVCLMIVLTEATTNGQFPIELNGGNFDQCDKVFHCL